MCSFNFVRENQLVGINPSYHSGKTNMTIPWTTQLCNMFQCFCNFFVKAKFAMFLHFFQACIQNKSCGTRQSFTNLNQHRSIEIVWGFNLPPQKWEFHSTNRVSPEASMCYVYRNPHLKPLKKKRLVPEKPNIENHIVWLGNSWWLLGSPLNVASKNTPGSEPQQRLALCKPSCASITDWVARKHCLEEKRGPMPQCDKNNQKPIGIMVFLLLYTPLNSTKNQTRSMKVETKPPQHGRFLNLEGSNVFNSPSRIACFLV